MSLYRAAPLLRLLSRCSAAALGRKTSVNFAPLRSRSLSTKNVDNDGGLATKMQQITCVVSGTLRHFNIWTILRKTGVPYCTIIQFRRKMKKIYYVSGMSTVVRAAIPIIIGDLLAQTLYPHLFEKKPSKRKVEKADIQNTLIKNINWCRTAHFALIGGFLVGPLSKRWNLFWGRRVRRYPPGAYLSRILILDALILTPFIITVYTAGYDYNYLMDNYSKKDISSKLRQRYEMPITDMVLFYITTKPIIALSACFILPCWMRNATRKLYSILFYCFVSHTIVHFKLGEEITKRKRKSGTKGKHYDGGGGLVCMAIDKIHDMIKKDKK